MIDHLFTQPTLGSAFISLNLIFIPISLSSQSLPDDEAHQRPIPTRQIDFDREISPILSQHCIECHGPDKGAQEAKLRLDLESSAKQPASSGNTPIASGKPEESELLRRIKSTDPNDRMPPPDSGSKLTNSQIDLLSQWISEGANYTGHWAYQPYDKPPLPDIRQVNWPRQPLDYFILSKLESEGITPNSQTTKSQWIRRVYFDLIGLPPSPHEIEAFLADPSLGAYGKVADHLLASPRYGERWGRHWLDVARYGDSNGGDENHAYPHAYHFRNYVINAFNAGMPYDSFISEQLAGDLLPPSKDGERQLDRLKATGFLAIGTKILAEQDPVKKQADAVDEQIDTVSKALLGITVACARCHDHKFDPIPTKDYYAFAGIFHSTKTGNTPLKTSKFLRKEALYQKKITELERELQQIEETWKSRQHSAPFREREAESFDRGNVQTDLENYGKEIGIISDPGSQENFAEYDLTTETAQRVALEIRYAAEKPRPGKIHLNGEIIADSAFSSITGGWGPDKQAWHLEAILTLPIGKHIIRLESNPMMVHIDRFRLIEITTDSDSNADINRLIALRQQRTTLLAQRPVPEQTMTVNEGDVHHVKIHIRGDHNSLGEEAPRGFLTEIGPPNTHSIPIDQSGRRQLSEWLTAPENPLTARVFVNRVWRWHFGKGLVESTENFGTRGSRPSHPELLNYLAKTFIENDWSIKALHRAIVLSSTYQLSSQVENPDALKADPSNGLYWKRDIRRLEAEAFRDSLLALSGRLNSEIGGSPMNVKSQDPSPQDLVKNREIYEKSSRRSVYLPVVRSNVYDFLTLLDFPNAASPVGNRSTTTVPTQALLMMNHDFVQRESERILAEITDQFPSRENASDHSSLVHRLYLHLLGRAPNNDEMQFANDFISSFSKTLEAKQLDQGTPALSAFCHTLLMSNEFSYIW
jgi:hypothetical protein